MGGAPAAEGLSARAPERGGKCPTDTYVNGEAVYTIVPSDHVPRVWWSGEIAKLLFLFSFVYFYLFPIGGGTVER